MKDKKFSRNMRKSALTALLVSLSLSTVGGLASCKEDEPVHVDGIGSFYYDTGADSYQLVLGDNYKATLVVEGELRTATYAIEGNLIKLTFSDGTQTTATLGEGDLTLAYDGGSYRFFKRVEYKVSYEELGGSEVADETVVNGQTAAKPADPTRSGYEFLGWYTDAEYKNPYSFDTQLVTGNVTLYAQWAEVDPSLASEYVIDFELGYDGDAIANRETNGGKLYNVPTPTREGYKFCGWWISDYEDGTKLTYKYDSSKVFSASTTLYAVWEEENLGSKLSAPQVQVKEDGLSWDGVDSVSIYKIKISGPRGYNPVDTEQPGTNFSVDFSKAPEGDYVIEVTAVSATDATNNATSVRYYKNKAVGRVSQFSVIDGYLLKFVGVENAEGYYITIDCGDEAHPHNVEAQWIGDSTTYNFSACEMQEGGIKFTVTAVADGMAATTSEAFVYNRVLDKVEGLSVDEETQVLSWYPVKDATNYVVTVSCGDSTHTHTTVNVGSKTSFSLKECSADADGKVKVSVYAQTPGYNSAAATELVYDKTKLAAPSKVSFTNTDGAYKLSWKAVTGATSYSVKIGNVVLTSDTNEIDVTKALSWVPETAYEVQIKANGEDGKESVWSDVSYVNFYTMSSKLSYKEGMVTWKSAVGATGYQVRVNSSEIVSYGGEVTSASVIFDREGTNTVYVRFVDATQNYYSNWVSLDVENVQSIVFDSRGGSAVDTQYKAMGDKIELPTPTREGYKFSGWYNTPKGPESNGDKYDDEYFTESSELVLYAYWTPATYTVSYVVGADGAMNETETQVVYTKDYVFDVPTVEDGSKVFVGWFAGPDISAQQLTDDKGNSLKNWSLKGGMTVYAHYVTDVLSFTMLENGTWSVSKGRNIHKVTSVTIPETYKDIEVTVIEGYAFQACSKITSITMPDTIEIIERSNSFYLCRNLEEINVYHVDGNNTPVFSSSDGVLLHKDEITGQNQLFFYPLAKSGTYEIPEGVTEIPLKLFEESQVTEVVVPASVAIIRADAFYNCHNLEKVTFLSGSTDELTIENGAFVNCTSLVEITLPARLAELTLDEETRTLTLFNGCSALQFVNVERGSAVYSSVDGVLTNVSKTKLLYCPVARRGSYTIPAGIVEIGESSFYGCEYLTEIIIPGYVEVIEDYAFYGCSKAVRVVFDEGAIAGMELTVGNYAFANATNLKSVEFKEGSMVTTLGEGAFANAEGLREFTVPASMTTIGDYAFDNCKALVTVAFAENGADLTFGNYVFNDCTGLKVVELPASVVKLNLGVFDGCVNISEVKVHEDSQNYKDIDGIVFSKDGKELLFFPKGRKPVDETTGEYVIPEGVEVISEAAFKGVRYITKIVINDTVTYIGKNAFANSLQLSDLTFEEGGTEDLVIAESAFEGCAKIQSLVLPERATVIEAKAFYNVSISSIKFPAGLTTIGDYAFARSSLTSVEIPAGLTTLGEYVFDSCAVLTTVTFQDGFNAKEIPTGTFQSSGLTAIEIPSSIERIAYFAFNDCSDLASVTFASGTADLFIGYASKATGDENDKDGKESEGSASLGVFSNCGKLGSIEIPDRTVYIGKMAFSGNSALATVSISENCRLQRIDTGAFYGCVALNSIYIPKTVQNTPYVDEQTAQEYAIGKNAFYNSGLTTITFGMGGTGDLTIGEEAFCGTKLTELNLPNRLAPIWTLNYGIMVSLEGISRDCFTSGSSETLAAINVEEGGLYYGSKDGVLYKVKDNVLYELTWVPTAMTGSITVPKTVEVLADYCAQYSKISEIVWEDAENADGLPLTLGKSTLQYMPNLTIVHFPERTVAIGDSTFYGSACKVVEVYFPKNLETIGISTFRDCRTVTTVTFADGCKITQIPTNTFYNATCLTAIRVPANVESIGAYAFRGCSAVTSFGFEEGSKLRKLQGGVFYQLPITELVIPDGVTSLESNVFNNMTKLKKLWLPAGFTSISTMENNQDRFLFGSCSALEEVNIDEANQYYKSVDGVVYTEDGKTLVYWPRAKAIGHYENQTDEDGNVLTDEDGNVLTTFVNDGVFKTPAGVQTIGTYAFYQNSKIKELVVSADLTFINPRAFSAAYLKKLTFEDRVLTLQIGDYAFQGCSYLGNAGADTLTIPAEVEIVGTTVFGKTTYGYVHFEDGNTTQALNSTFYSCTYLKEITNIPSNLSSMTTTFYGCSKLTKAEWAPQAYVETMTGAFYNCKALTSITLPEVGSLGTNFYGAFSNCTSLTSVTFGGYVGKIGQQAFDGCTKLKAIEMPDTVSQLGEYAFRNCTSLENLKLSSGLEAIAKEAFSNCSSLKAVDIRGFVTSIGDNAFYNCVSLESVTLSDGLTTIGKNAFYGASKVSEIVLPDGLVTIGDKAFYGWAELTALTLPASLTSIGASAFEGAVNVESITVPEGAALVSIGDYAFKDMTKMKEFFISASLTDLGVGVFSGWTNLDKITVEGDNLQYAYDGGILYNATYTQMIVVTPNVPETLVIPTTVTSLAKGVFAGSTFKHVVLHDNVTEIPDEAFRGCVNLETITMPKYLEVIGEAAFEGCVSLTCIDIPASVRSTFEKGELLEKGKEGGEYVMGYYDINTVDGIGVAAFANCTSLTTVNFIGGGTQRLSFGAYAFYNCSSLTSITIPNRVRGDGIPTGAWRDPNTWGGESHTYVAQGIGAYAFARCTKLESVVFEETGIATYTESLIVGIGAFTDCTALKTVQFNSALGDVVYSMFDGRGYSNCGMAAIHARAFAGCTALTEVKFADNYDFTKMTVVSSAFADSSVTLHENVTFIDGSQYEQVSKGEKVAFSCDTFADTNYQIYGCAYCQGKGQECAFYDVAPKYGFR